jgi:hypothetical protein
MSEDPRKWLSMLKAGNCNKWLVGVDEDGSLETYDGCHDTPQGVAKALELRKQIRCINPKLGTRFLMVTVEEVPDFTGEDPIDQEAIEACNLMSGEKNG